MMGSRKWPFGLKILSWEKCCCFFGNQEKLYLIEIEILKGSFIIIEG